MPLKPLLLIAFATIFTLGAVAFAQDATPVAVDPAIAAMTNEQLVDARQNAMKQNGGILRGAGGLTGAEAVTAATTLLQNFTNLPALFKEGSATDKSKALPAVWANWEDFKARFDHDVELATAMLTAAQSGDTAAYGAAVQGIGESCGGCHMTYRGR